MLLLYALLWHKIGDLSPSEMKEINKMKMCQNRKSALCAEILQIENQCVGLWDFHSENLLSLGKAQTSLALLSLTRRFVRFVKFLAHG